MADELLDAVIELFSIEDGICPHYNSYLFLVKRVLSKLDPQLYREVLDVGCGAGICSMYLARRGFDVTGIDTWAEYPIEGRKELITRLNTEGINTRKVNIANDKLPFAENSFDLILFLDVLEHLLYPRRYLTEFIRILRPGGKIVIQTPNGARLIRRVLTILGRGGGHPVGIRRWYVDDPFFGHIREFTPKEVRLMLEWSGFTITKLITHNANLRSSKVPKMLSEKSASRFQKKFLWIASILFPNLRSVQIAIATKSSE